MIFLGFSIGISHQMHNKSAFFTRVTQHIFFLRTEVLDKISHFKLLWSCKWIIIELTRNNNYEPRCKRLASEIVWIFYLSLSSSLKLSIKHTSKVLQPSISWKFAHNCKVKTVRLVTRKLTRSSCQTSHKMPDKFRVTHQIRKMINLNTWYSIFKEFRE